MNVQFRLVCKRWKDTQLAANFEAKLGFSTMLKLTVLHHLWQIDSSYIDHIFAVLAHLLR